MRRWSSRCVIESNQPKKPIPPGLKPIQPGERHQSASLHRVRFLVLEKFQPDRSEDVGRSFEDVWVDAPLPQCRSQLFFLPMLLDKFRLRRAL
jgi:hypothetical protein